MFTSTTPFHYVRQLLLALCLCVVAFTLVVPQHIQAAGATPGGAVTVIGGNGTVQDSLSAAANSVSASADTLLLSKEFVLDPLFYTLARKIVQSMTRSIVNWINSGFQGSPAFVTDLGQMLLDAADEVAGDFIYNNPELNFLCSPFQLDVKVALATSYRESSRGGSEAQCTLSGAAENIEGFLSGSFSDGGWESWFEVTQNPTNTPTGAFLAAESEMYARIVDDQGNTLKELDWGNGFLSFKVCSDTDEASGAQQDCDITTPGSVIANQINKSLGAGQDALITADEVNEIIGALFAQLAEQAITGINGLLGLGGSSYSNNSFGSDGGSSYLDALEEENNSNEQIQNIRNPFPEAITGERAYMDVQEEVLDVIGAREDDIEEAEEEYEACFDVELPNALQTALNDARLDIAQGTVTIANLEDLNQQYDATTDPAEKIRIVTEYQNLQAAGFLHTELDAEQLRAELQSTLRDYVIALDEEIEEEIDRCN